MRTYLWRIFVWARSGILIIKAALLLTHTAIDMRLTWLMTSNKLFCERSKGRGHYYYIIKVFYGLCVCVTQTYTV